MSLSDRDTQSFALCATRQERLCISLRIVPLASSASARRRPTPGRDVQVAEWFPVGSPSGRSVDSEALSGVALVPDRAGPGRFEQALDHASGSELPGDAGGEPGERAQSGVSSATLCLAGR